MAACGATEFETLDDGTVIMTIDCEECAFFPSIENEPKMMAMVLNRIMTKGTPTIVRLQQITEYEYDQGQTAILTQLAKVISQIKGKLARLNLLEHQECKDFFLPRTGQLQTILTETILTDPLAAYVKLVQMRNADQELLRKGAIPKMPRSSCLDDYARFLEYAKEQLESTTLITKVSPDIFRFKVGDRTDYSTVFKATIKPDFMRSKIQAQYPLDAQIIESYTVNDPLLNSVLAEVTVFLMPDSERKMYHVVPVEANLTWEKYNILHEAKQTYQGRKDGDMQKNTASYMDNPRGYMFNIARGLIFELGKGRMSFTEKELDELASILVRHMIGFGIIEILLTDKRVQDIIVNSPTGKSPIYVKIRGHDECFTNIFPTRAEAQGWATRLRFLSGRPLDEAHPILDTDKLEIPGNFRSRSAIITSPLIPHKNDYAFAIRQHAPDPVTFARYSQSDKQFKAQAKKNKKWGSTAWGSMMLAPSRRLEGLPLAAGLLSFLVDGNRTFLVAGTRSSGKTTLLSSLLVNISRKVRIITIEDTLEIPVQNLKSLGFNVQSMKVRSALARGTTEVSAEEGIRSTLRLGDSALVVGEVRSTEAKSLYEAMRVGALANVVAGTIHANDPYGVFDRVVNDLGVPATSFKATDIIVMARPLPYRGKRVTSITEVRKFWVNDPLVENGFINLVEFDHEQDSLEPTEALMRGDSDILKEIGARIDAFAGRWDRIWENILLRAKVVQTIIDKAIELDLPQMIRAPFYVIALDAFRDISNEVYLDIKQREGEGAFPPDDILRRFVHWLDRESDRLK
jgi:type IV secretory pathway ATPase VirB11/archaellum biosynthesis ATPase